MNAVITVGSLLALMGIGKLLPLRRLRLAFIGATYIAGGCAAFALLVNSTAMAQDAPRAEADFDSTDPAIEAELTEEPIATDANRLSPADEDSLAPRPRIIIPPGRPDWVEADFTGEQQEVQRLSVSSGLYQKKHDALRALDVELNKATQDYVASYLGSKAAGTLVQVETDYIRANLVQPGNTYSEVLEFSVGPMHQTHALLEFTPSFHQHLEQRWRTITVTGRTLRLGVIAAGVLFTLSLVFGYFRADTATRGYYTTRLQLLTATGILALVAGGVVIFRYL
jgi:hypothetical protein